MGMQTSSKNEYKTEIVAKLMFGDAQVGSVTMFKNKVSDAQLAQLKDPATLAKMMANCTVEVYTGPKANTGVSGLFD